MSSSSSTTVSNPNSLNKYDVKIYYSTFQSGNALYLGGPRSTQELSDNYLHNFFQKTTEEEQTTGIIKYRCGYFVNTNPTISVKNPIAYIVQDTSSPNDSVAVGWGYADIGSGFPDGSFDLSVEPTIDTENDEPDLVDFYDGNTPSSGAVLGEDIPPGMAKPFWIQYTSNFNAQNFPRNTFILRLHADNLPHNVTTNTGGMTLAQFSFPIIAEGSSTTPFITLANNVLSFKPDFIATAGNNNVNSNPSVFMNAFKTYMNKMLLCFGDRDVRDATVTNAYVNELAKYNFAPNITRRYYSKDYGNVHVCVMDTSGSTPYTNPSDQYTFVSQDLKAAFTNPATDWIIVITNRAMYGSQTATAIRFLYSDLRDTYHQLFTDTGVLAVIQGTYHFYERSKVLGYNPDLPSQPKTFTYNGPRYTIQGKKSFIDGSIFLTIGTGGVMSDTISLLSPYSAKTDQLDTGFLLIRVNNATSDKNITFSYYVTSRSTLVFVDSFSVTKLD